MPGGLTPTGQYLRGWVLLLAALLDKRPDEFFSVGFQNAVDFVKKVIHSLRRLRGLCLGCCRGCLRYIHFGLGSPGLWLLLLLCCHFLSPYCQSPVDGDFLLP
ncbi:hypothetical protein ARUE_c23310 [Arthrobacter sp. Rue61a]|nr:hypothetical protein ARUE_c23310 [Arthrobacter sp. Rue61a]